MPSVRELLARFRPVGVPGAASAAGVPVDRVADRTAELAPVFAQLARTEQECDAILEAAERQAQDLSRAHQRRAEQILAAARARVEEERAGVLSDLRREGDAQAEAELERAREQADRVRRRAAVVVDDKVAQVTASVRALIAPAWMDGVEPGPRAGSESPDHEAEGST